MTLADRVTSVIAVPAAPFYATAMAYRLYHPKRNVHKKKPADLGLEAEETEIEVPGSGIRLHAWLVRGKPGSGTVVMGHPVGMSKGASLRYAKPLHEAGYTVCLYDLRNHGQSGSDRMPGGLSVRYTDDLAAVVRFVRSHPELAGDKIAAFGFSFSTFQMFYVMQRPQIGIDAVICDSGPVRDLAALFGHVLQSGLVPFPAMFKHGPAKRTLVRSFGAANMAMLATTWPPPASGAYTTTPFLLLAGELDPLMPAAEVSALAELYPRATARILPGTGHLTGIKTDPGYMPTVLDFLSGALASG